jgi:hypothetical protein
MLKGRLFQSGFTQIPVILGLVLMLAAIPLVTKLSQQNQENRSKASECPCNACPADRPNQDSQCGCVDNQGQNYINAQRQTNCGSGGSGGGAPAPGTSFSTPNCGGIPVGQASFNQQNGYTYNCVLVNGQGQWQVDTSKPQVNPANNPTTVPGVWTVDNTNNQGRIVGTPAPTSAPTIPPRVVGTGGGATYTQTTIQGMCNEISCPTGQTKNVVYGSGGYNYCVCSSSCLADGSVLSTAVLYGDSRRLVSS